MNGRETEDGMASYELLPEGAPLNQAVVVDDLAVTEVGHLVFHDGAFWSVKRIERATHPGTEGLLVLEPAPQTRDA